jgi:hypothetical protein
MPMKATEHRERDHGRDDEPRAQVPQHEEEDDDDEEAALDEVPARRSRSCGG